MLCKLPMLTAADDRYNGWLYTVCYVLIFLAAPVLYVGVVQASLLDKLGASATVANLPASTYMLGQVAPLVLSWLVPHRLERAMVVWANVATAGVIGVVFAVLAAGAPAEVCIAAVVAQGLLQGLTWSASFVFMTQCLRRGTSEAGLAETLKRTYAVTPLVAVAGSLGAQYVLNPGFSFLPYPLDFAAIYLLGAVCVLGVGMTAQRFRLEPVEEEPRGGLGSYLLEATRGFFGERRMVLLWVAYVLWYASLGITSNLSLYTRTAMGRDPKDFSGLIMALRFGCKSVGGYVLGGLAVRAGIGAGVIGTTLLLAAGCGWAWVVPGAGYLLAFGLLGAGELGGAYYPNYVSRLSAPAESTRNLAMLTLATPASSFAPVLHGALSDRYGFAASFALGIGLALAAVALVVAAGGGRAGRTEGVGDRPGRLQLE
jgi:hypothetical protein